MRSLFKTTIISLVLLASQCFAFSNELEFVDPVVQFKNEISTEHTLLKFEIKRISASYPSAIINAQGKNYPGYRGPGQLVVYYPEFSETTGTNEFGTEAVVEKDTVVRLTGANSLIPKNGFVISGHGSSKKWIKDNLKIGTKIRIEGNTLIAYTIPESFVFSAKEKIKEAESFIQSSKKANEKDCDDKRAQFYLKKAKSECRKADRAKESLKVSYAKSSEEFSKLAIKYALPYIESEFKGVWVRPKERNVFEIAKTLDEMKQTGIKEIFLETYFHGYTIYPSEVMKKYGLTSQNPKFLGFDPLKIYITEAHKRGMKVHCWFESFYIGNKNPSSDPTSILSVYPSWGNKNLANYDSKMLTKHPVEHYGYFLDPANKEVTKFLLELLSELSTKYKIDGINLDYTRYPSAQKSGVQGYENSHWGYTETARNEFKEIYEADPIEIKPDSVLWKKWAEYRQDKIFDYVKDVKNVLAGKNILFTAVIFPDYDVCIQTKQQDWVKWARYDLVDGVTPLIMTSDNELFFEILKDVKSRISNRTKVYTGLFVGFLEAEPEDLLRQISVSRRMESEGVILFDWAHLPVKYRNALRYRVFLPSVRK